MRKGVFRGVSRFAAQIDFVAQHHCRKALNMVRSCKNWEIKDLSKYIIGFIKGLRHEFQSTLQDKFIYQRVEGVHDRGGTEPGGVPKRFSGFGFEGLI